MPVTDIKDLKNNKSVPESIDGNMAPTVKSKVIGSKSFNKKDPPTAPEKPRSAKKKRSLKALSKNIPRKGVIYNLSKHDPKRMHVFCDLDSTLINSLSVNEELSNAPDEFQKKFRHVEMKGYYRIFERPFLQFFLDFLFANFTVSVFTAADKDYALHVVDKIILTKPERRLKYLFYGYASELSEYYYKSPKDLRILWNVFKLKDLTPCSTIIIDDLNEVYEANPDNTIKAPKFELLDAKKKPDLSQVNDNFLISAISVLKYRKRRYLESPCSHYFGRSYLQSCKADICKPMV